MIVVSDTTPLRRLIAIGEADILRQLFGSVIVPHFVWAELHAEATPDVIKRWLVKSPNWLKVQSPQRVLLNDPALNTLDAGELEAIQLASELSADLLLMDDREGRSVALRRNLPVIGTIGVLERADILGLLPDLPNTLRHLQSSGFYLSDRLRDSVLLRYRDRRDAGL